MWEIEIFFDGLEIGTFDFESAPALGVLYEDMRVLEVMEINPAAKMARVAIEFVLD